MRKSVIPNQFAYEIKKSGFAVPENKYKVRENIFAEAKKIKTQYHTTEKTRQRERRFTF